MSVEAKIIKGKVGLLKLAEQLGNVSQACKTLGYSRDTFYRYQTLYASGGEMALKEMSRKKPIIANRVEARIEEAVVNSAIEQPAWGQLRTSNELKKQGILISPGGVRSIWLRHDLARMEQRLKALEVKMARERMILTEAQLIAMERQKEKRESNGEIETEHPGYLGAQDTYYVGHLKGVGRVYQQTFIDTYSKVADAKLYTEKNALTAADMLNDRVIPFFDEHKIKLLRVLTDRGTEYCGQIEHHAYQLYLAVEDIEHTRTKASSPQTNGICERFHKTLGHEFYAAAFRKKVYGSLAELQQDLDEWLNVYNTLRTHTGKYCYGKTPMQTFIESMPLAREKQVGQCVNTAQVESDKTLVEPPAASLEMTDGLKGQGGRSERSETQTPLTFQAGIYAEVQGERNGEVDNRVRLSDMLI